MKKFLAILLILVLMANTAFADDKAKGEDNNEENQVTVIVQGDTYGLTNEIIDSIKRDHPEASVITIHEIILSEPVVNLTQIKLSKENFEMSVNDVPIFFPPTWWEYSKTITHREYPGQAHFLLSVPKGGTLSLSSTVELSMTSHVSGKASTSDLGLKATAKATYSKTQTYSGPDKGSPYNSRKYYARELYNRGIWNGTKYVIPGTYSPPVEIDTDSGTFSEAIGYLNYSIDVLVN